MWMNRPKYFETAAADGASAGGGQGNAAAANQPWFPETQKAYVETKGWKSPTDVLDSYVNLEKLFGADKAGRTLVLPKDDKDVEGLKAFHTKLGVPESPDKYELPLPEGDDGAFAKTAAQWMHKAGVPKAAAQTIAKDWNDYFTSLAKNEQAAAQAKSTQELNALKSEWGNDFAKNEEFGRRGLRAFGQKAGLDQNDLTVLETAIGTAKMLKLFAALGQSTAEPGFVGGEGGGGFAMSTSVAQAKLDDIRVKRMKGEINDAQWKSSYQTEFERLSQLIAQRA